GHPVTATATATTATGAAGTLADPTGRRQWHRLRLPALILLVVLAGAVLVGLAGARVVRRGLDPDAVDPAGRHALAGLLGPHGVTVHRVSTVDEAAAGSAGTAVLVPFPNRLAGGQLRRLAGTAARLVLVAPDAVALHEASAEVLPTSSAGVSGRAPG